MPSVLSQQCFVSYCNLPQSPLHALVRYTSGVQIQYEHVREIHRCEINCGFIYSIKLLEDLETLKKKDIHLSDILNNKERHYVLYFQ